MRTPGPRRSRSRSQALALLVATFLRSPVALCGQLNDQAVAAIDDMLAAVARDWSTYNDHRFLGWTAKNEAVVVVTSCTTEWAPICEITLHVADESGEHNVKVFRANSEDREDIAEDQSPFSVPPISPKDGELVRAAWKKVAPAITQAPGPVRHDAAIIGNVLDAPTKRYDQKLWMRVI